MAALLTPEEHLARDTKSEYIDGQVYAVAGANERHNLILANVIAALGSQLRGSRCRIYPSDLKVRVATRFFYPDASVSCGPPQFIDEEKDVVLNPTVLIAVLSERTMAFDRGAKFLAYQQIPTLQDYLLISQEEPLVERFQPPGAGGLALRQGGRVGADARARLHRGAPAARGRLRALT